MKPLILPRGVYAPVFLSSDNKVTAVAGMAACVIAGEHPYDNNASCDWSNTINMQAVPNTCVAAMTICNLYVMATVEHMQGSISPSSNAGVYTNRFVSAGRAKPLANFLAAQRCQLQNSEARVKKLYCTNKLLTDL